MITIRKLGSEPPALPVLCLLRLLAETLDYRIPDAQRYARRGIRDGLAETTNPPSGVLAQIASGR
jgi:hypothetical protein